MVGRLRFIDQFTVMLLDLHATDYTGTNSLSYSLSGAPPGLSIDSAQLSGQLIPWTRRTEFGRRKAYRLTTRLAMFHPRRLAAVSLHP